MSGPSVQYINIVISIPGHYHCRTHSGGGRGRLRFVSGSLGIWQMVQGTLFPGSVFLFEGHVGTLTPSLLLAAPPHSFSPDDPLIPSPPQPSCIEFPMSPGLLSVGGHFFPQRSPIFSFSASPTAKAATAFSGVSQVRVLLLLGRDAPPLLGRAVQS